MGVDEVMLLWSADSAFLCSFNSGSVAMAHCNWSAFIKKKITINSGMAGSHR